jgi:hypothetical protein
MKAQSKFPFLRLPSTRMGWWAVGLAVAFIVMFILNATVFMRLPYETPWRTTLLPYYGILMMAVGLVSGVLGLITILTKKERSGLVWFTLLPGAFCLIFLLGEFLYPH